MYLEYVLEECASLCTLSMNKGPKFVYDFCDPDKEYTIQWGPGRCRIRN